MRSRSFAGLLLVPVLALSACGDKTKPLDTAAYTCADFNKSLAAKSDNSAGRYINERRKQAKLGQEKKIERREITLGIYFACRGKPGSTKPATAAVSTAKQIKAGKFKLPGAAAKKKKSGGYSICKSRGAHRGWAAWRRLSKSARKGSWK